MGDPAGSLGQEGRQKPSNAHRKVHAGHMAEVSHIGKCINDKGASAQKADVHAVSPSPEF